MGTHRAFSADALRAAEPEDIQISRPHQVFFLGLDDLKDGRALPDARATGWRYVVSVGAEPIALAETVTRAQREHALAYINYGPFVAGTTEALPAAQAAARASDAELRVLHIPALYVQALWLHTETEEEDTLIPIAPTPPGIEAIRPYSASELLGELRERSRGVPLTDESDTRGA
jgi:hypothetical protein